MTGVAAYIFVLSSSFVAAFVSGIFGMGGGFLLLGVLLTVMDVATAMVVFSLFLLVACTYRAYLWREHIVWPIIGRYLAAAVVTYGAMRVIAFVPDKALVYVCLGLMPFAAELLPKGISLDVSRPRVSYVCGVVVSVLQVLAGGAGNVLDVFFQKSPLDRKKIVATKAATQPFAQALRAAYFLSFFDFQLPVPAWLIAAVCVIAMIGTTAAGGVLNRMNDMQFRRWSQIIIYAISLVFLGRGIWLYMGA
ncbi:MAG: hypothetical protein RLZ98_900 [Pseudomonadota bacterium]|jgi:uncharacterized membrane protein YfcA